MSKAGVVELSPVEYQELLQAKMDLDGAVITIAGLRELNSVVSHALHVELNKPRGFLAWLSR